MFSGKLLGTGFTASHAVSHAIVSSKVLWVDDLFGWLAMMGNHQQVSHENDDDSLEKWWLMIAGGFLIYYPIYIGDDDSP